MKTALILIDIQNDYFLSGKMELIGSVNASNNAKNILSTFRKIGSDIIHIQHISEKPNATFFLPNSIGAEIHSSVSPVSGELILVKKFPNSFRNTALHETLIDLKIEKTVFVGMMTHMCVDSTVRAAFDHGYKCVLLSDCCATKNLEFNGETVSAELVNAAYFSALNGTFAEVKTSDEFISNLMLHGDL